MTYLEAKAILEILQDSITVEELKKAYKKSMLRWHPDNAVHRGVSIDEATAKTRDILLAKDVLSQNLHSFDMGSNQSQSNKRSNQKVQVSVNKKQYYDYSIDNLDDKFLNRITMKSSNVKWIDYLQDIEVLVVRFKNSSVYYLYFDVPFSVFIGFQKTDSPGRYVRQQLRHYEYESHNKYADWLNVYKGLTDNDC